MYKNIIRTAFLFATGIFMTACSSGDDELADSRTPVTPDTKENTVTLTGTISAGSNDITRAVDTDGKTVYWEVGDEICVHYKDKDDNFATVKGKITKVESDKHYAKFEATLINLDAAVTSLNIGLAYPYSNVTAGNNNATDFAIKDGILAKQAGTIAGINEAKLDIAWTETEVGITIDWTKATATLNTEATLSNQVCICKFNILDGSDPLTARMLEITKGNNTTPDYTIVPASEISTFYVVLPAISSTKLKIEASTCGDYGAMKLDSEDKLKAMKSDDVRKYISVDPNEGTDKNQAYLCTNMTAGITTAKICKHTYPNATLEKNKFYTKDLTTNTPTKELTPIAVVSSVGEVSSYWKYFLALALDNVTNDVTTASGAQSLAQPWAASNKIKIAGNTYEDMYPHNYDQVIPNVNSTPSQPGVDGNYNPSKTYTGEADKGWRIPSVTDWRYVIANLGGDGARSATEPAGIGDHNFYYPGNTTEAEYSPASIRGSINNACGNTNLIEEFYWSSSYYNYNTEVKPWRYNFAHKYFVWNSKQDYSMLRAVFAY